MKFIWLIVGIVLAGLGVGYWTSRRLSDGGLEGFSAPRQLQQVDRGSPPESVPSPLITHSTSSRPNPRLQRLRPHASPSTGVLTNWQERVGAILSSDLERELKEKALLDIFPRLPPDGQVAVVQQLEKMLPDKDYAPLARYALDPALAEPVLGALFDGLLERPERIRLPLLLTIAEEDAHPKSEEALSLLQNALGQTYGTNWDQWNASLDQRLNAQSAEEDQDQDQQMDSTGE